ncbi:spore germination protein [Neobacillus niacini]|uniref:spore germination protein n=1 Tax=Neobacillus niacini TaxID=86668 RepID=UPI00286100A8|nr:spore germination protein [Neobacillus niacini]MDR7001342.1 spore germination protein PF [Neobacillus niacini]
MPTTISGVQIDFITTNGIVKFGDSFVLTPKTTTKSFAGSGAFNSGIITLTNSGLNSTNSIDTSMMDEPITGNN